MDSIQGTRSRIRRRSQRIPLAVPLVISSLDPNTPYGEHGESIEVSSHGCSVRAPKPLNEGIRVRLDIMHTDRSTTAHVVRSEPGKDEKNWEIALELDRAENFWGIRFPPEDWPDAARARAREVSTPSTTPAATPPPTPERDAGDTIAARPVAVPTPPPLPPPTPAPPTAGPQSEGPVSTDQAVQDLEPALREKAKEISAEFEESYRQSLGDLLVRLRADFEEHVAADWERVRNESVQKLRETADDFRQQLEQEREQWRRQAAELEEKLGQLARLEPPPPDRQAQEALSGRTPEELQAELRMLVKEEVQQRDPVRNLEAQVDEVRQARDYIESLIRLLPQTVEQRVHEGITAALERVQARIDSEFSAQRENELEQIERRLLVVGEQLGNDLRQKFLEDFDRHEREFLDRIHVRLEEARTVEGGLRQYGSQLTAELAQQSERVVAEGRSQVEENIARRKHEVTEELERRFTQLQERAQHLVYSLGEETWRSVEGRLYDTLAKRQQELERIAETAGAEVRRAQEQAEKLAARLDTGLERGIDATVESARERLAQAGETARQAEVNRLQAQLESALQPLVSRAESVAEELRTSLNALRADRANLESLAAGFQEEARRARTWLAEQTGGFEKAIENALIEATGQIKGRISQGVEMAQGPLERRVRELQAELDARAAAKTEELRQQLELTRQRLQSAQTELEASVTAQLNARLAEVLDQFRQQVADVSQKATAQVQGTLNETLESISRVFREKFGPTS